MGASGSGKPACLPGLRTCLPDIDWRDFDDFPSKPTSTADRQRASECWLQEARQNQERRVDTGIVGTVVFGEMLACPSAEKIEGIHAILLDCYDVTRIDRILARNADGFYASQEMLCWAAWQRMHGVDPQWRQDVIQAEGAEEMHWERWRHWKRGDPRWRVESLDNTDLTIQDTVDAVVKWVGRVAHSLPTDL